MQKMRSTAPHTPRQSPQAGACLSLISEMLFLTPAPDYKGYSLSGLG